MFSDYGVYKTVSGILDVTLLPHKQNKTNNQTKTAHENEATENTAEEKLQAQKYIHPMSQVSLLVAKKETLIDI